MHRIGLYTPRMWRYLKEHGAAHVVRVFAGWLFIVLGLLGLVLPILQGLLFLAIGALLLAPYVPFFRRMKAWIFRRFPRVRKTTNRFKQWVKAKIPGRSSP